MSDARVAARPAVHAQARQPKPHGPGSRAWRIASLVLAAGLIVWLTGFGNAWPTLWIEAKARVSLEALALVAIAVWSHARLLRRRSLLRPVLASAMLLLVVMHYVNVTVPALFGRELNLYWDGRHLPGVAALVLRDTAAWQLATGLLLALIGLACLYLSLRWALTLIAQTAGRSVRPRRLAVGIAVLVVLGALGRAAGVAPVREFTAPSVAAAYGGQAAFLATVLMPGATDRRLPPSPDFARTLRPDARGDVLLVFAESYGATSFDRPDLRAALADARNGLARAIDRSGRDAVSAFVRSPTFGGGSWLAHASLLAGIDTRDPQRYALLLASPRASLVSFYAANGYRTLGLMPGLRSPWPEGAFYGFDHILDARALGYTGPEFGFWRVPDQYSIQRLHRLALAPEATASVPRAPVFAVFPTITTHAPFEPVPPLARDWNESFVEALPPAEVDRALARRADWGDLVPGYLRATDYFLRWFAGYVEKLAPPGMLLIVVGDHQPAGSITGPQASWDVPVYVISDSAALLERLRGAGFSPGLSPAREPIGAMHELTQVLLDAVAHSPRLRAENEPVGSGADDVAPARVDVP